MVEIVKSSRDLTKNLAQVAINIRENIKRYFSQEEENGYLHQIFQEVKDNLLHDLTLESFADMYAQTVTHGLFSIRAFRLGEFNLKNIPGMIPKTSSVLKKFFSKPMVFKNDLLFRMYLEELGIKDLIQILENTNVKAVFYDFNRDKNDRDPIIHFYEDFLRYYDPEQKMKRGVFYTPDPIVSFIIRSVDQVLKTNFDIDGGLATDNLNVQILDPATGTGTFLSYVIDQVKVNFGLKNQTASDKELKENWNKYVDENLLHRMFGFELMPAPFVIAHLKLNLKLKESGYKFSKSQSRVGLFLTNTLEGTHSIQDTLDDFFQETRALTDETRAADEVKINQPITIVLGNPPYSGHSANNTTWIKDLLRGTIADDTRKSNYFEVDERPLGEKNPKFLQDDYVKFIRFAQWRIEKTGHGIVAFITNHSFLDNPTFRGMRQQLMKAFSDIYILDLHGNTRRKETCPDGSKDENVFDIQQGVCVSFFIKNPSKKGEVEIYKADLWGLREKKYNFLENNDISTINWRMINSFSPWYMFYHLNMTRWNEYQSWWKIPDIFSQYSVGIMTGQDSLTIQETPQKVQEIIGDFILLPETEVMKKYNVKKDKRQWTFQKAKLDLEGCGLKQNMVQTELRKKIQKNIVPILYRPFDKRYTFFTGISRGFHERPRGKVMKHMIDGDNLGLIVSRNSRPASWRDIQISEDITELGVMATRPGNNAPIFPLFLFRKTKGGIERKENFSSEFKRFIEEKYRADTKPAARDIIYYIYAMLHSRQYRRRYEDFLKIDFPRIPFTDKWDLFVELKETGKELVELHLMRAEGLNDYRIRLKGSDDLPEVKRVRYTTDNRLLINNKQYFEEIHPEVYNYYIGGYQVCRKWLRDRKRKVLSKKDLQYFSKIVKVIQKTISLMERIDQTIEQYNGWYEFFSSINLNYS